MSHVSLLPASQLALSSGDMVLWDVVEEHLAEAAFCVDQFEQALDHPSRRLSELDRHPEGRLHAHIDALVIGGTAVRERLLIPALENADPDEPARVTAAALALIEQGAFDALWPGLSHENSGIRDATVRAASLAGGAELDRWVASSLTAASSSPAAGPLLELHAARGLGVPALHKWLRSPDPVVVAAAARAARWADPSIYRAVLEGLADHPEPQTREAAIESALCLGSEPAWTLCQRMVVDGTASPRILALGASLGNREIIGHVARGLDREARRPAALFALTFSGDPRQVPSLIEHLRSDNLLHAKLALQAISGITGLDLRDDAFALAAGSSDQAVTQIPSDVDSAEALAALPLLEEDDLDGNLVLQPEDALPRPNPDAVERFWGEHASRFDPGRRYLAGAPFSVPVLLQQLECAPLRWRHVLALSLCVRSGAQAWVDTRAWSATQRAQIAAVRSAMARAARPPLNG